MASSTKVATVGAAAVASTSTMIALGVSYPRRPPAFSNSELLDPADRAVLDARWQAPDQDAPSIFLHAIGPAELRFPGVVRLPDGRVLAESLHNLTAARRAERLAAPWRRAGSVSAGPVLLMARAGSVNYGHWLVEHFGVLLLLRAVLPGFRPCLAVNDRQGSAMWQVYADSAVRAGLTPASLLPIGGRALDVADLYMLSPSSEHPYMKHPAAIAALSALAPTRPACDLLFVRRTNTAKRVLRNLAEVEAIAARLGFRFVEPGRMTLAEQIETFAGARVVAGVSGADLTNVAFMPSGGEVICLLPATGRNLFFWDLCCLCGHRYWSVFGPPLTSRGGGHDDFEVDVGLVAQMLAKAVSSR